MEESNKVKSLRDTKRLYRKYKEIVVFNKELEGLGYQNRFKKKIDKINEIKVGG